MDDQILKLADAVLYEGYLLYPYRATALKNRRRFDLGVLGPGDNFQLQIPFVGEGPRIRATLRFLRLGERSDDKGKWQEGREETVVLAIDGDLADYVFWFDAGDDDGIRCGRIEGTIEATRLNGILTVTARNDSAFAGDDRDEVLLRSLVAAHAILEIDGGEFVSLLEPPDELAEAAARCVNKGVFPILAGNRAKRNCVFASPVILYDFPEIAPESAGDMFDGAEIDELLTLRILTMTDDEKREMAATDPRGRALLERTEALSNEELLRLHGRLSKPSEDYRTGDRIRLKPRAGGDVWDAVLAGKTAIVEAVEIDFENRVHLAVVIEDDPGRDLGMARMPGHRFFYGVDEVEKETENQGGN